MEAAWRSHMNNLTLEQLSSSSAVQNHINQFQLHLVAKGLGDTVIGSSHDVLETIATFINSNPAPPAQDLARLTTGGAR